MNKNWLWILLALMFVNNTALGRALFGREGAQQGGEDPDSETENSQEKRPKSQVHHMLNRVTNTHNQVRNMYDSFESLASNIEKILSATVEMQAMMGGRRT